MKTIISLGSPIVSLARFSDTSGAQFTFASAKDNIRRSAGRLNIPVSIISVLVAFGVVVAYWAPAFLDMLDYFGGGLAAQSEALGWSLFIVGAFGLASVVYLAWQDTRDPAWRAAHGLPPRPRSTMAGH